MADPVVHITAGIPDSGTGNITTLGQTLLDGANITHGTTTDAAVVAGAAGSLSAKLRSISRDIAGGVVLQTGANTIGAVSQAGAPWSISGSVSITGTAAVTQSGTWSTRTVGNAGGIMDFVGQNAVAPANAILIGGEFNTTPTTIVSGNASPLQLDSAGNLLVNIKAGGAAGGTSSTVGAAAPATATAIGFSDGTNMQLGRIKAASTAPVATDPAIVVAISPNSVNPNGSNTSANSAPVVIASDQAAVAIKPTTQTAGGTSTTKLIAAASTNATSVKASAGTLYGIQVFNNSATIGYLKLYNKASAPTVGTDTPVKVIMIPASAGAAPPLPIMGVAFGTGIAFAVTGGIADADTTAVAASAFTINLDYA